MEMKLDMADLGKSNGHDVLAGPGAGGFGEAVDI
jgi:hypothetical protein